MSSSANNPPTFVKPTLRCSGLDRAITCPGSRTLEQRLAEDFIDFSGAVPGDEMTWRGNWCHYESARILVEQHGAIAPDGLALPDLPPGWEPSPWDIRTARWYVNSVIAELPEDYALFVEQRFTSEFELFILSGQLDTFALSPDGEEFIIEDDKTGPNEVDHAEENWQLAGYAALLKRRFPKLKRGKLRIRQRMAEVQTTEVVVEELDLLVSYLESKINQALYDWRQLSTAYKACRLCPCIQFCPALRKEIEAMEHVLSDHELQKLTVIPSLKELAELAARGRAIAGPIKRLLDELKARVIAEGAVVLSDGTQVRVIDKEGTREITNPKRFWAIVEDELKKAMSPEEAADALWNAAEISITEIEDLLVNELGMQRTSTIAGKPNAQKWVKDNLGYLITRKPQKQLKFG